MAVLERLAAYDISMSFGLQQRGGFHIALMLILLIGGLLLPGTKSTESASAWISGSCRK